MIKSICLSYLELCKPRIIALMLLTSTVGILLAPATGDLWNALIFGNLGIGLCASAAAAINHVIDQKIDAKMRRTSKRPLVKGSVDTVNALIFAAALTFTGMALLIVMVNATTAVLTMASLIGYAIIYTSFLKRVTTQNIVIGGIAGAMPPLLGWVAVTDSIDARAWLLVLIIFLWTPPHFWALAIAKKEEYEKTKIPMFSVIYGIELTSLHALLYSLLLIISTMLLYLIGMTSIIYLVLVTLLNIRQLHLSWKLWKRPNDRILAMQLFWYSIYYLMLLFAILLLDKYLTPLLYTTILR